MSNTETGGSPSWFYIRHDTERPGAFQQGAASCPWCHPSSSPFLQCLQYKTDQAQDVKKIEKLQGKLMRLMVSKETHSGAMETD